MTEPNNLVSYLRSDDKDQMDRLLQMVVQQAFLQRRSFGHDVQNLKFDERIAYIKENVLALQVELAEALAEVSWKSWAKGPRFNHDAYFAELIDVLHFLINLFLADGSSPEVTAQRIYEGYVHKRAINAQRQEDGYDGVTGKCATCKRALDDPAVTCDATTCHVND